MTLVTRHIPIVFYNADGTKVPVGVLELAEGDNVMIGTITDPRVKEILLRSVTAHLSIDPNEVEKKVVLDTHIQYELLPGGYPKLDVNQMKELDRCARAYGFEVGRGHALVQQINGCSDDNPFLDPDWREKLVVEQEPEKIRSDHEFGLIPPLEQRHIPLEDFPRKKSHQDWPIPKDENEGPTNPLVDR